MNEESKEETPDLDLSLITSTRGKEQSEYNKTPILKKRSLAETMK